MAEILLDYDRAIVRQEVYYSCGAAACEITLNAHGIRVPEMQLVNEIGTTVNGTDYVGLIEKVLNRYLPDAHYTSIYLEQDPPTQAQKDTLWANLLSSIRGGHPVVMNWVSPPGNRPRACKDSVPPNYGSSGNTVFHYVTATGIDDVERAVYIADSGFTPQGYWCPFEGPGSVSSLIPPKGYCYASAPAPAHAAPEPVQPPAVAGEYVSRSPYRGLNEPGRPLDFYIMSDDSLTHTLFTEISAVVLGDPDSIYRVARAAAGKGADTSPEFMGRARRVLAKVPRTDLAQVVARIETQDPQLFALLRSTL